MSPNKSESIDPRLKAENGMNKLTIFVFQVEKKLSQMILDQKLSGSLDQGEGMLIVFDIVTPDEAYQTALDTIHAMGEVVDALYSNASKIN